MRNFSYLQSVKTVLQLCATTRESDSNSEFTSNLKLDKSSNIFQSNNRICCKINVDYEDAEKEHILVFPHHLITELTSDKSSAKIVLFKYTCKILLHFAFTKTIPHKPSSYSCRFQSVLCKQEIIIAEHWRSWGFLVTSFSHLIWDSFHPVLPKSCREHPPKAQNSQHLHKE